MKIRCVVPNTSPVLRDGLLAERRQAAGPGVFVDVVNIRDGPISPCKMPWRPSPRRYGLTVLAAASPPSVL